MSKAVNNRDTDIVVILVLCGCQSRCISKGLRPYRIGIFLDLRGARGKYVWGIELGVHGIRLTCIDHKEHFIVAKEE